MMTTDELKAAMRKLGYEPSEYKEGVVPFAAALGVSSRMVYFWLSGRNMSNLAETSIRRMAK